jgi:hypothetical protein
MEIWRGSRCASAIAVLTPTGLAFDKVDLKGSGFLHQQGILLKASPITWQAQAWQGFAVC